MILDTKILSEFFLARDIKKQVATITGAIVTMTTTTMVAAIPMMITTTTMIVIIMMIMIMRIAPITIVVIVKSVINITNYTYQPNRRK